MNSKESPLAKVEELAQLEFENCKANLSRMTIYTEVFDKLFETYRAIFDSLQEGLLKKDNTILYVTFTNVYMLMIQDLVKGMTNFSKGYVTDASFQTRRIIESAVVAMELFTSPKKQRLYLSVVTEEGRKRYIEEFKIFYLIKKHLSPETQIHYEHLCFSVHPSALAIGGKVSVTADVNLTHSIRLIEFPEDEDLPSLLTHYMVFLKRLSSPLSDLVAKFRDDQDFDSVTMEIALRDFDTIWQDYRTKMIQEYPQILQLPRA